MKLGIFGRIEFEAGAEERFFLCKGHVDKDKFIQELVIYLNNYWNNKKIVIGYNTGATPQEILWSDETGKKMTKSMPYDDFKEHFIQYEYERFIPFKKEDHEMFGKGTYQPSKKGKGAYPITIYSI